MEYHHIKVEVKDGVQVITLNRPEVLNSFHLPMAREQMKQMAAAPVLMVLPQLRPVMARYARLFAPGLNVLSYNEMPDSRSVVVVGSIG